MKSSKENKNTNIYMKNIEKLCKSNNLKLTALRKQVLELIISKKGFVKAYDLLNDLKKIQPNAKPPTIYRSLDFLEENGFIHKLQSLNAFIKCTHPKEHANCYFLICKKCNNIEEVCSSKIDKLVSNTSKEKNFSPKNVTFEISGICYKCMS